MGTLLPIQLCFHLQSQLLGKWVEQERPRHERFKPRHPRAFLRPVCAGGVKRPIGIFKRIDKGGNKGFHPLLWHNHPQDLDLRLLPHSLDIVRKPGISREARIVVSGDLTVERPVIDPFELQMINRVNLVAEASQGDQQRLRHVLV